MPCAMRDAEKPVPTQTATNRTPMIPLINLPPFAITTPGVSILNHQVTPASSVTRKLSCGKVGADRCCEIANP